jgi:hypothetical protein
MSPACSLSRDWLTREPATCKRDTVVDVLSRSPATSSAGECVLQKAVARHAWAAGGVRTHTSPSKRHPVASSQASEGTVMLKGQPSRTVVVQSSAHEQRCPKRLDRESQESAPTPVV